MDAAASARGYSRPLRAVRGRYPAVFLACMRRSARRGGVRHGFSSSRLKRPAYGVGDIRAPLHVQVQLVTFNDEVAQLGRGLELLPENR